MKDEVTFKREVDAAVRFAEAYGEDLRSTVVDHYLRRFGPQEQAPASAPDGNATPPSGGLATNRPTTVAELSRKLKPKSGTQHLLVAASYLEQQGEHAGGWSKDSLFDLFREMRFNPTNPHDIVTKAKRAGLLMEVEDGLLLTQTGVDAYSDLEGGDQS